jgi:hypothetical protein
LPLVSLPLAVVSDTPPLWYSILCSNLNGYRHHHLDLRRHLAVINYRFPLLSSGLRSDTPFWPDSLLSS